MMNVYLTEQNSQHEYILFMLGSLFSLCKLFYNCVARTLPFHQNSNIRIYMFENIDENTDLH